MRASFRDCTCYVVDGKITPDSRARCPRHLSVLEQPTRCKCSNWSCAKYKKGLVFHMGQHRTRKQVIAYIRGRKEWRGAKLSYEIVLGVKYAVLTLGTAVLRVRL